MNKELRQSGSIPHPSIESNQTPVQKKNEEVISVYLYVSIDLHPINLTPINSHGE